MRGSPPRSSSSIVTSYLLAAIFPFFLQTVAMDIARTEANAIVLQDMMTGSATGIGTTEIVTEGVTETAMEAEGMTDVSRLERDTVVVPEIMMTIRDVLPIMKMTVAGTSAVHAKKAVGASEADEAPLAKTHEEMAIAVDEASKTRKGWVPPNDDHPLLKALYHCRRGGEKLLGGMFMRLDMNSILPGKLNKQVGSNLNQ